MKWKLIPLLLIAILVITIGFFPRSGQRVPASLPDSKLPDQVFIKTPYQTFNSRHYFALKDGRIYFKPNEETTGKKEPWKLFERTGLPGRDLPVTLMLSPPFFMGPYPKVEKIVEIYADADELLAIDDKGIFHLKTTASASVSSDNFWHEIWGFPKTEPLKHNDYSLNARGIAFGRRHGDALYSEDTNGNAHHYGTMGTSTIYVLGQDGNSVRFTDSGLPQDFSHSICLPERGRFIAESISASASMIFVIDKYGRMRTHLEDFDINGGLAKFYTYTYEKLPPDGLPGSDPKTTWTKWALPLDNWPEQPSIPLEGEARISRDITILQTGHGNAARELRVAGLNEKGESGFYHKMIYEKAWKFKQADIYISPERMLDNNDVLHPEEAALAPSGDIRMEGTIFVPGIGERKAVVKNFHLDCSPVRLEISIEELPYPVEVDIHLVETWTMAKRKDPGRDGTPKLFLGTIEVLDPEKSTPILRNRNLETFAFSIRASTDYLDFQELNRPGNSAITGFFSLDGLPKDSFEGLSEPVEANVGVVAANYYLQEANNPSLLIEDLEELKSSDTVLLRSKLEANRSLKEQLRKLYDIQSEAMKSQKGWTKFLNFIMGTISHTPIKQIPGMDNASYRWASIMKVYSDSNSSMFSKSEQGWKEADELLKKRIQLYEKKLEELRDKLIKEARQKLRQGKKESAH